MPKPAEIDALVLQLDDRSNLRETVEPFEEGVFDDLAKAPREGEKPLGPSSWPRKKITK